MNLSRTLVIRVLAVVAIAIAGLTILLVMPQLALAQDTATGAPADPEVVKWALVSAAGAAGMATLAAGYAVAMVGSAAVGAIAEKPELLGRVIILVGLAEGIAIYGLIVAILILNRAG
jgi:V/A-type H+-transporting ATPase subunit K